MGLRIQHNIAAMNAHRNLTISNNMMEKSMERLSSGYRINKASDDAAGLAISSQMRTDIASLGQASRNVAEANSQVQTVEGAFDQISNILTRLKELATQASSANASGSEDKIDAEAQQLKDEIDRIGSSTSISGTYQVGSANDADSQIDINSSAVDTTALGIDTLDLSSAGGAQAALTSVDTAVGSLSTTRGDLGAIQNRLGYAAANLATTIENTQAAESVIRDVDMAAEMTSFTKSQILMQAGTAMLAQANQAPQQVLSLFR
jgi:flagellin